jgi:hypothetical protein
MSKTKPLAAWPSQNKNLNNAKFNGESTMKLNEKIEKVNDNFSVYMYDNGFMLEISGRDDNGDWATAKILCKDMDQLISLIKEAADMERD